MRIENKADSHGTAPDNPGVTSSSKSNSSTSTGERGDDSTNDGKNTANKEKVNCDLDPEIKLEDPQNLVEQTDKDQAQLAPKGVNQT